jgi:hypothetical protein
MERIFPLPQKQERKKVFFKILTFNIMEELKIELLQPKMHFLVLECLKTLNLE